MNAILVPLDGSSLAEQAVPVALGIATRHGARLDLVTVHEFLGPHRAQGAPQYDTTLDAEFRREQRRSVEAVAVSVRRNTTLQVIVRELEGPVLAALAGYIETEHVDLVVMTAVGRGRFGKLFLGSVADGVVRRVNVPVLLVHPNASTRRPAVREVARVLIPLDGSEFAERVVEHAIAVGGSNAEYVLLCVVPLLVPEVLFARAAEAARVELEPECAYAEAHLADLAARLRERGLRVKTRTLLHHNPARAILEHAAEMGADLIAITTHGHGAAGRLLIGSVAHKVLQVGRISVLLYRPTIHSKPAVSESAAAPHSHTAASHAGSA